MRNRTYILLTLSISRIHCIVYIVYSASNRTIVLIVKNTHMRVNGIAIHLYCICGSIEKESTLMARSKQSTQQFAMAVKGNRESAVNTASQCRAYYPQRDRARIYGCPDHCRSADRSILTNAIGTRLLSESRSRSIDPYHHGCSMFALTGTSLPRLSGMSKQARNRHDQKRDVDSWDKARIKALERDSASQLLMAQAVRRIG
jgi:hypothetical protein